MLKVSYSDEVMPRKTSGWFKDLKGKRRYEQCG
jgi:hypothetical protein